MATAKQTPRKERSRAKKKSSVSKKKKVIKQPSVEEKEEREEPKILLADDDGDDDSSSSSSSSPEKTADAPQEEALSSESEGDFDEEILPDAATTTTITTTTTTQETSSLPQTVPSMVSDGRYHNKQRCLVLSSRGITSRYRHFLEDMRTLIPHHKKEGKLDASKNDTGGIGRAINDIAEMRGCNSVLFMECRKRQDAYLWIGSTATKGTGTDGPSAKFLVENVHTMDELRLTGNCMRGSRPILTFDSSFEKREELKLLKVLFGDVFGTPRGHPKSKPFVDRVMGFYYADGKIWIRNFQIVEEHATTAKEAQVQKKLHGETHSTSLVEIGPRFVLNPIRIFRGSFGGQTLYQNSMYVSPNEERATALVEKGGNYKDRKQAQKMRKERKEGIVVPEDPLGKVFD